MDKNKYVYVIMEFPDDDELSPQLVSATTKPEIVLREIAEYPDLIEDPYIECTISLYTFDGKYVKCYDAKDFIKEFS